MRPTRHDWPRALGLLGLLIGAAGVIATGNWVALLWVAVATTYAAIGYIDEKTSQAWKARYFDVKAQRDRAVWGEHLS